jgi:hypothetical protein
LLSVKETTTDAEGFVNSVNRVINGALVARKPENVWLIQIRNYFSPKWLGFSGKALGAIGTWQDKLTVPPFVPNRVLDQRRFTRSAGSYLPVPEAPPIHTNRSSSNNLGNRIERLGPHPMLCWYSSNSVANQRGALMVYSVNEEAPNAWYVTLSQSAGWAPTVLHGISGSEYESLANAKGE